MFNPLPNKYTTLYFKIIQKAKQRTTNIGYTENHHIHPRALGGSDEPSNLIRLSAREHYLVHWLLTKMLTGHGYYLMSEAFWNMTTSKKYKTTSRVYESIRTIHSDNFRKTMTEYWSNPSNRQKMIDNNPMHDSEIYGKWLTTIKSDSYKQKLSNSVKTSLNLPHIKHNNKLAKIKMWKNEEYAKNHPMNKTITCEHCGKSGKKPVMTRWHGDNCKYRS